jgi:hypothetical protein|tara:strand:+ start:182 stop:451 length:270 start_codon:yes stop_codon:yes gene_type:complete
MPKDACYHKVKARYKVFPSAYASGAIAKCRKVGAANYGKSSKKKKAAGGIVKLSNGGLTRRSHRKRPAGNSGIARGCGVVKRRKVTKYV